jgi:transposase InsO family protein
VAPHRLLGRLALALRPARSPWQNAYAERLIGSLRRECLDHVVVLDEVHLRRILGKYFEYYNRTRCHLSLVGDAPEALRVPKILT